MAGLDDTDLRILRLLQGNPRLPVSKMAKAVGLTDNAVRYRVKRLRATSIIRGFVTLLDPKLLGRPVLGIVLLRLRDPEQLPDVLRRYRSSDTTSLCVPGGYRCEGEFNACLFVCAAEPQLLHDFVAALPRHFEVEEARVLSVAESFGAAPMPLVPELPGPATQASGDGRALKP